MRDGGSLCVRILLGALVVAACADKNGAVPGNVAGTWVVRIKHTTNDDVIGGLLDENGGEFRQIFTMTQTGSNVAASFVDGEGNQVNIQGTYGVSASDYFVGTIEIEAPSGLRDCFLATQGFARVRGDGLQIDAWARVEDDDIGGCVGAVVAWEAVITPGTAPQNLAPTLEFLAPLEPLEIEAGTPVEIRYRDNDEDDVALTDIYAEMGTTRYPIATARPEQDGTTQTVTWDTTGFSPGTYSIGGVTKDPTHTVTRTATTVTIGTPPPVACDWPGRVVDATDFGGVNYDETRGIAAAEDGTYFVVGLFEGTVVFGEGETRETTLVSAGEEDAFIARFHPDGTLLWAVREGGPLQVEAYGVDTRYDGTIVVTGRFNGTASFGEGSGAQQLTSAGNDDVFIAAYGLNSDLLWVKRAGGNLTDEGLAIASLEDRSFVVTGRFNGTAIFGEGEEFETTLTSNGFDIFVAQYYPNGALRWVVRAGGAAEDRPRDIVGTVDGGCVVTGEFSADCLFGPNESNQTLLTSRGERDMFVARYDSYGELMWVRQAGGPGDDQGKGIAVFDPYLTTTALDAPIIVTGSFQQTAEFDEGVDLTSSGEKDVFVSIYYPNGSLGWVLKAGGPGSDSGKGVEVFGNGTALVTGSFEQTAAFGSIPLASTGGEDVFYALYNIEGFVEWACHDGGPGDDTGYDVATFPNDGFYSFAVIGNFEAYGIFGNETLNSVGSEDGFVITYDIQGN